MVPLSGELPVPQSRPPCEPSLFFGGHSAVHYSGSLHLLSKTKNASQQFHSFPVSPMLPRVFPYILLFFRRLDPHYC